MLSAFEVRLIQAVISPRAVLAREKNPSVSCLYRYILHEQYTKHLFTTLLTLLSVVVDKVFGLLTAFAA